MSVHPALRLAIVAPRFWPLWGDAEWHWLALAESLIDRGCRVTVVSPLWRKSWPAEMFVGPVPLVRLRGSHRNGWRTLRWMYALAKWLRAHAAELDAVLVGGLRHEAYVAVRALDGLQVPVIVQAWPGDLAWQRTAAFGSRIAQRSRLATAIIASSSVVAQQLAAAGYAADRIAVIPRSVHLPPPRNPVSWKTARESLGSINHDLIATDATPIGLAVGRLDAEHCHSDLVRAWRIVTADRPEARLWIVGDGPERERLFRQICDLDLARRVLLPGTFDCLDELYAAADLYIQPAPCSAPPLATLSAAAAGLPVIAADSAGSGDLAEYQPPGLVAPAGNPKALAAQIERLLANPAEGVKLGAAAREAARSGPSPDTIADRHLELIEQLKSPS